MSIAPIPDIVIGRLPIYLRALQRLAQARQSLTSSQALSQLVGLSPAQIRKDLSYFGEFGRQGAGYEIEYLAEQLRRILKLNQI
jgi:redox-sensing transcriptional repressor